MVEEGGRIMQSVLDARGTEFTIALSQLFCRQRRATGGRRALLAQDGGRAWPAIGHHV